jgi:hypothetical protein
MDPPLRQGFFDNTIVVATQDLAEALFDCGISQGIEITSCAAQAGAERGLSQSGRLTS